MGETLPDWIDVRSVPVSDDPALSNLDAGERSAIALAQSETNALLLIDEVAGRREASRRGISNTGTLGILRAAALGELIDLPSALVGCWQPTSASLSRSRRICLPRMLNEKAGAPSDAVGGKSPGV